MCLVFCSYRPATEPRLLLIANRDERYDRPTSSLDRWTDEEHIIAGKDLTAGGTWLGVSTSCCLAVITNCRWPKLRASESAPSRGSLAVDYLRRRISAVSFLEELQQSSVQYAGFSLLLMDKKGLYYYHSPSRSMLSLSEGDYGLSNSYLNTPWPKLRSGLQAFSKEVSKGAKSKSALFSIMEDSTLSPDYLLPQTGIAYEKEKAYSARFIRTSYYGTRSTTLVRIGQSSPKLQITEKTHKLSSQQGALKSFEL